MALGLGVVLRSRVEPRHLWIILSRPGENQGRILFANFTTLRDNTFDKECILAPDDYPGVLTSPLSVIAFSRSKVGPVENLEVAVSKGDFSAVSHPMPPTTLAKIIEAARVSTQLSEAKKALLP